MSDTTIKTVTGALYAVNRSTVSNIRPIQYSVHK